jgi:peptidoglycan/LPS O-acetylase OafA/YrhL
MIITYLFFPVLYEAIKKTPVMAWGVVSAIFFAVGLNYQKLFSVYINCNPLMRLPEFLFGMSYAYFILKNKKIVSMQC